MSITFSIIIGVVSGILTSFVLFVLIQVFRKILIPWYQSIIYSGINIAGEWYLPNDINFTQDIFLQLNQSAYQISGSSTYVNKVAPYNIDNIRMFDVKGSIKDRFIQLVLSYKDTSRIGISVILLEVIGDGCLLRGSQVYYNISGHNIMSRPVEFSREKMKSVTESEQKKNTITTNKK